MTEFKRGKNISGFTRVSPQEILDDKPKPKSKIKPYVDELFGDRPKSKIKPDVDELFANRPQSKIKPDADELFGDGPMFGERAQLTSKKALTIKYTRLTGYNDLDPKMCSITWDGFCEKYDKPVPCGKLTLIEHHKYRNSDVTTKQQLPAPKKLKYSIIPGIFNRKKTIEARYLRARYLLVLEIDSGFTFNSLTEKLKSMELECVVHTSFFYSNSKNMFLVYIPFNKPLTMDIEGTCSRALYWLKSVLGDHINPGCWNVTQNYYYKPACSPDAVEAMHIKGKPFVIDNFRVDKDDPKMIKLGGKPTYEKVVEDFNSRADWRELLLPQGFAYFFTGSFGREYYKGVKKHKNAIIGTVDLTHNVFYVEKRAKIDSTLLTGRAYSPFDAYVKINYPGDEAAAIRSLKLKGYGKPKKVITTRRAGGLRKAPKRG